MSRHEPGEPADPEASVAAFNRRVFPRRRGKRGELLPGEGRLGRLVGIVVDQPLVGSLSFSLAELLVAAGQAQERPLLVLRDPRLTGVSDADLLEQYALAREVSNRTSEANQAVMRLFG